MISICLAERRAIETPFAYKLNFLQSILLNPNAMTEHYPADFGLFWQKIKKFRPSKLFKLSTEPRILSSCRVKRRINVTFFEFAYFCNIVTKRSRFFSFGSLGKRDNKLFLGRMF